LPLPDRERLDLGAAAEAHRDLRHQRAVVEVAEEHELAAEARELVARQVREPADLHTVHRRTYALRTPCKSPASARAEERPFGVGEDAARELLGGLAHSALQPVEEDELARRHREALEQLRILVDELAACDAAPVEIAIDELRGDLRQRGDVEAPAGGLPH